MSIDLILTKALNEEEISRDELKCLIAPSDDQERLAIRAAAREMRLRKTGRLIYSYGFIYLSTYCRNDCRFCAYRLSNPKAIRYRKNLDEVLEAAHLLAEQGVNLIDLTMGEDPSIEQPDFIAESAAMVKRVKGDFSLPVMISPGVLDEFSLKTFREAGADWYACYQETHNQDLFAKLRHGQSYEKRWQAKVEALKLGFMVEEGVLCGVGESVDDLADSILIMKKLGAKQVRAMGFVPPKEALSEVDGRWVDPPCGNISQTREIDMIAALRLALPDSLIPATLDVEGLSGLKVRLEAGANLITSLVPADLNLAGVAQANLDINNQARSIKGVKPVVEAAGLSLATPLEYQDFLNLKAHSK